MGWKISDLQGASLPLSGNELLELTQDENSRKVRVMDLLPGFDGDTLAAELSNDTDPTKGAAIVGRAALSVASVFDLLLAKRDASQVIDVAAYHPGAYALSDPSAAGGGGRFRWKPNVPKSSHNGGTVISPTVPWNGAPAGLDAFLAGAGETDASGSGAFVREQGDSLGVCDFGAIAGNDTFDNRVPFQKCIDACSSLGKKFVINPTPDSVIYHIKSFHPDETKGKNCLVVTNVRNFHAVGHRKRNTNVKYTGATDGKALLRFLSPSSDWGFKLEDLGLDAGGKLDHVLLATNTWYAHSSIVGGTYSYAKLDGIRISLYMGTLNGIHSAAHGRDAYAFCGPDDQGGPTASTTTSLTVTSCWARLCGRYGFSCENAIWYSNFISCGVDGGSVTGAADRFQTAYKFYNTQGLTLSACGAEKVDQYFNCDTFVALKIDNPKGTDIGPTTGQSQAMIFLGGGFDAQLTNIPNGLFVPARFQYAIATNANTGNEKIDIFGSVIERSHCYFTPSTSYKNWPDVFYFPGQSGTKADRGKTVVGCQVYSGPVSMAAPAGRTLVNSKVVDLVSSTVSPQVVDLLEVAGNLAGPVIIKVELTVAKYAGSPAPAVGAAAFVGTALIASSAKTGGAMTKIHGDAYTANLVWSGDKLTLECSAQYSAFIVNIEFWSRAAFCKFL